MTATERVERLIDALYRGHISHKRYKQLLSEGYENNMFITVFPDNNNVNNANNDTDINSGDKTETGVNTNIVVEKQKKDKPNVNR